MQSTRTFVAIEVGPPASTVLSRLVKQLSGNVGNVKWVQPDQLHITAKFLGDVDNRELPKICDNLREACSIVQPFVAAISGLGTFPRNKPPRVVWAGIQEGSQQLAEIHSHLDDALVTIGIPRETRSFSPHLTLGRVGRGAQLERLAVTIDELSPSVQTQFEVNQVLLLASVRERGKVIYEPIDTVELA